MLHLGDNWKEIATNFIKKFFNDFSDIVDEIELI